MSASLFRAKKQYKQGLYAQALLDYYALGEKYGHALFYWNQYKCLGKLDIHLNKKNIKILLKQKEYNLLHAFYAKNLIVSLTSYPARIATVAQTIDSILQQSFVPLHVILWLSESQFANKEKDLPQSLLDQKEKGLTIQWTKDTGSYKKIIPALEQFPDKIIVTADDDILYNQDWLLQLIITHISTPKNIICHRAHEVQLNESCQFAPYALWEKEIVGVTPSISYLFTGCGGVLYPPGSLHSDVLRQEIFMEACPKGDDLWLWGMAVKQGTKVSLVANSCFNLDQIAGTQDTALWRDNVQKGHNDVMLAKLDYRYPEIRMTVVQEKKILPMQAIKVSVIIPVYNTGEYLAECLESLSRQSLENFEVLCIDDGSNCHITESILQKYSKKRSNFKIIRQINSGPASARNHGLRLAKGAYIAFLDSDDQFSHDYLKRLYATAIAFNSDISVAEKIWNIKTDQSKDEKKHGFEAIDCKPNQEIARTAILATGAVWNKLYKKDFLIRHDIQFLDGMKCQAEDNYFTFFALMHGYKNISVAAGAEYYYRQHEGGITKNITQESFEQSASVYRAILERLEATPIEDKNYWQNTIRQRAQKDLQYISNSLPVEPARLQSIKQMFIRQFACQINIVCIADDKYILPTAVFLKSLKINKKSGVIHNVTLLTPKESAAAMQCLQSIADESFKLDIKGIDSSWLKNLHQYKKIDDYCMASPSAMFKFIIPDLFPDLDRILYLDTDLMVRKDLLELYLKSMEDEYLCAVPDMWNLVDKTRQSEKSFAYFNSGVMLMNLKKMRMDEIPQKLVEAKIRSTNFDLMDQDVFNKVCAFNCKPLDINYNFLPVCYKRHMKNLSINVLNNIYHSNYKNLDAVAHNPAIAHWAGSDKPWVSTDTLFADEWRQIGEEFSYPAPQR